MAEFQSPPTYAEPVVVDERTGQSRFNPIWLKWFLDLVQVLNDSGGTSTAHNSLSGIQGGAASERYHLNATQAGGTFETLAATLAMYPPKETGVAQTATKIYGGSGVPNNANGANGDFYFRSDGGAGSRIYFKSAGTWAAIV